VGLYTVTAPCVVGDLHYALVPAAPVFADDDVAADLVAAGVLIPVAPAADEGEKPEPVKATPHRRRADKEA
jgi:hypothetical protein